MKAQLDVTGVSPLARSRLRPFSARHSVSINNHVSGTDTGTAKTASSHVRALRKCLLRSAGHDGSLRFLMPIKPLFKDGHSRLMPRFQIWHTIVTTRPARAAGGRPRGRVTPA